MTYQELVDAQTAYNKLTALQTYRQTLADASAVDIPPGLVRYSLTLPDDIQTSAIAVVDAAIVAAQAAFDAL
jgi:hypothetical protein